MTQSATLTLISGTTEGMGRHAILMKPEDYISLPKVGVPCQHLPRSLKCVLTITEHLRRACLPAKSSMFPLL